MKKIGCSVQENIHLDFTLGKSHLVRYKTILYRLLQLKIVISAVTVLLIGHSVISVGHLHKQKALPVCETKAKCLLACRTSNFKNLLTQPQNCWSLQFS